ncbi:MAG: ABC transporter permease [Anaerolineae bacterium]
MSRYIVRRLLQAIPLLLIMTFILFVILQVMGDPLASLGGRRRLRPEDRARLRQQLGLDKPIWVQYLIWLKNIATGNWGNSFVTRRPVTEMILQRLPNTLLLMLTAQVVILIFSLAFGVYSALKQYSVLDHALTALSFIGYSMPIFWLALMMIYIFAVNFKKWGLPYFPTGGVYNLSLVSPGQEPTRFLGITFATIPDLIQHMVLPIVTLSIISIASYTRYIRSCMLEVINQDYIRTARSKGVPERAVILRHALKNASLPLVTLLGIDLPFLLGGAIVTESIFAWPGMGRLFWEHAVKSDFPLLMGILLLVSTAVVFFQIITDISYAYLDPRIRYE